MRLLSLLAADPPFMFILKQWHFIFWILLICYGQLTQSVIYLQAYDCRNQGSKTVWFLGAFTKQLWKVTYPNHCSWAQLHGIHKLPRGTFLWNLWVGEGGFVWVSDKQQIVYVKTYIHFNVLPLLFLITRQTFLWGMSQGKRSSLASIMVGCSYQDYWSIRDTGF